MSSRSDADGPASADSGPSTDLLQALVQKIKALEESAAAQREFGATQSATIASQGAIIDVLNAAVEASKQETETLKAAMKTSEQTLKAAMKTSEQTLQAAAKTSEQNTETLKATVATLEADVKKSEKNTEALNATVEKLKRTPRNLVICIDGTSNQFGTKNTNVVELYHRLIRDETQLTFYNSGIGTYATPSWKSWRYWRLIINNKIDLAIAWNFEGIIISAYRWLSENYEPGDKIFVFGFSRGAYQIRALAAMIDIVGLLRKGNLDQIPFAYELYAETKKTGPWTIVWIIRQVLGCIWTVIFVLFGWGRSTFCFVTRRLRPKPNETQHGIAFAHELCSETGPLTIVWIIKQVLGCIRTVIIVLSGWRRSTLYFVTSRLRPKEKGYGIAFACEVYAEIKKTGPVNIAWIIELAFEYVRTVARLVRLVLPNASAGLVVLVVLLPAIPSACHVVIRWARSRVQAEENQPDIKKMCKHFKDTFSQENVVIEFAGAWDTVSSVGFIRNKTLPGTTDGMENVKYFRHALALHERRVKFLNENSCGGLGPTEEATQVEHDWYDRPKNPPHTKEVWFAGSHGDIGGGAIANLDMNTFGPSLRWMLYEAVEAGLRITSAPETEKEVQVHNSLTWPWVVLEYLPITRLTYRDRDGLTSWPHRGQPRQIQSNQLIHSTALASQALWRAHLPKDVEWSETFLRDRGMIEEDQYTDTKGLIARLSTLPPKDDDLDALTALMLRGDGKLSLRNTVGAEATLLNLLQLRADRAIAVDTYESWNRWQSVGAAALTVSNVDAAERRQLEGQIYSINHLLLLVDCAEDQNDPRRQRFMGLLVRVLINALEKLFKSSKDIAEKATLRALEVASRSDDWKHIQAIPDAETEFIKLLPRYSTENDPNGSCRQVIADVVLQLNEHEADWKDNYYSAQELQPILARARERNDPELLQRFEKRYARAQVHSPFQHSNQVYSVAWMPDSARIVSGCDDNAVRVWDVKTGAVVGGPLTGHSDQVWSVAVSHDGSKIASGSRDDTICVWDAQTGEEICCLRGHTNSVVSVAFSPDGAHIASGSSDKMIRVWDIASGVTVVGPIQGHEDYVYSVAYSPDRSRIVSGSKDNSIRVWNAKTGEELWQTKTLTPIYSVAYSPDGKQIVAGGRTEKLILDAETGAVVRPLGEGGSIFVEFSPDGKKIASAYNNTVQLWDAETGDKLDDLRGHRDKVYNVTFSPDGKRIASASWDGTVRIWDATGTWRRAM